MRAGQCGRAAGRRQPAVPDGVPRLRLLRVVMSDDAVQAGGLRVELVGVRAGRGHRAVVHDDGHEAGDDGTTVTTMAIRTMANMAGSFGLRLVLRDSSRLRPGGGASRRHNGQV